MFYKTWLTFWIVLLFYSCKTKTEKNLSQEFTNDSAAVGKYLINKQFDSATPLIDKILEKLHDKNTYATYCQRFIDEVKKAGGNWQTQKKYYNKICEISKIGKIDTVTQKIITNAYFNWALLSFQNENRADDSVIVYWEKAIALNKKKSYLAKFDEDYVYRMLGVLYNQIGDIKKTLYYYTLSKAFVDTANKNWVALNIINKSIALKELGQLDSVIILINKGLVHSKISGQRKAELLTILSEVKTSKGFLKEAHIDVNNALYILDTTKHVSKVIEEKKAQALKQKGILQRLYNKYDKAIQTELAAIAHYKATGSNEGRGIAKIYIELGKSYQGLHQYDSALYCFQTALHKVLPKVDSVNIFSLPQKTQIYAENTIMEAMDAKANVLQLLFSQNKNIRYLQTAVQCYDLIVEVEKLLLQNFSYDESRLIMLKESRTRSEKAINACYQLFMLTNDNSWVQKAFEFAEKNKAFVLLESIKRNIAANTTLQNDSVYQQVQSLQTRLVYIDRQIIESNNNAKNDSLLAALQAEKSNVNTKLLLANNELKLSSNDYQSILENKDTTSALTKAYNLIDDQTGLVEFFVGDSTSFTFLYTKKEGLTIIKNDSTFLQTMMNYASFLANRDKINNQPWEYQNAAYSFYSKTNISKFTNPQITKLLFITDGYLSYVPFESLVTNVSAVQTPKLFSYLINNKEVSYGYSIASLTHQLTTSNSKKIIAFAPAFVNSENGKVPLVNSINELEAIKKAGLNGKYFTENKATAAAFKSFSSTADIIHIASHAYADTSANMQSSIAFYGSAIYLNELYSMHFSANLVVLSACETNIGLIDKSEGSMSLARGFYYAGAKNIITSLWNVNDKSTATLFGNFYKNTDYSNYTQALQKAKLAYIKNASTSAASPYYWASFIHIGYTKEKPNNHMVIWLIAVAGLFSVVVFMRKYRK